MMASKPFTLLATAALIGLTVSALASCGGDNTSTASSGTPKTASGGTATVSVENSDLGKILVNAQGHTLYMFQKDTGTTELLLRRLRQQLAAVARERQDDGRQRRDRLDDRNHLAVGRQAAGHIQRPPALPLPGRQQPG